MKNIIYFHGIHGDTQKSIAPFLEKEFKVFGYETLYPKFFEDGCATYENFKIQADKLISKNKINNDTIIISHSIGNSFSIRYLFENKLTPFAYISLAGYCDKFPLNDDIVREQIYSALPTKEELNYVKTNIKNRISLYSNDHLIPQELLINFSKKIDSKLYYLENKGHFGRRHGVQELPELIEILKENNLLK